jgi:multimeric flavodoxin WrbA
VKVLAVNGSPKMDKGNTALVLTPFLQGMTEAGAEVELLYTKKLKINPCQGELNCWFKTPGRCFQKDDMQTLHSKLREADIWVFATPVYADGPTGTMKNLTERTIPLLEPYFVLRDGHCRHALRGGSKPSKVALVSSCGLWEMDNFDPLVLWIKAFCANLGREFGGALLRPHAEALMPMMEMGISLDDIFQAAKEAGRSLVNDGKMPPEALTTVSHELLPLEMYNQIANQGFEQALAALEK